MRRRNPKFGDLSVGDKFVFSAERKWTSMAQGPWVKTGPRTYVYAPDPRRYGGKIKVGTLKAEVDRANPRRRKNPHPKRSRRLALRKRRYVARCVSRWHPRSKTHVPGYPKRYSLTGYLRTKKRRKNPRKRGRYAEKRRDVIDIKIARILGDRSDPYGPLRGGKRKRRRMKSLIARQGKFLRRIGRRGKR